MMLLNMFEKQEQMQREMKSFDETSYKCSHGLKYIPVYNTWFINFLTNWLNGTVVMFNYGQKLCKW